MARRMVPPHEDHTERIVDIDVQSEKLLDQSWIDLSLIQYGGQFDRIFPGDRAAFSESAELREPLRTSAAASAHRLTWEAAFSPRQQRLLSRKLE